MVNAIIFDFFDVIHSDPFKRWLRRYGFAQTGGFEDSSRLVDLGKISEHEFYRRLSALSGQDVTSVEAVFGNTDLIDHDLTALIGELRSRYSIGLLSNSSSEYLRAILAKHQLFSLFDAIVISAELGHRKPSPEIFTHMLEQLDVSADKAVFIDDNRENIAAAQRLGISAIHYTSFSTLKRELSQRQLLG